MLSSSLNAMLTLSKTTSPQKLFHCIPLYSQIMWKLMVFDWKYFILEQPDQGGGRDVPPCYIFVVFFMIFCLEKMLCARF